MRAKRIAIVVASMAISATLAACQVLLTNNTEQCQSDKDCSAFADATCDVSTHLCVTGDAGAGDGGCTGKDGCYACSPHDDPQFFNSCTDAGCVPFDRSRLKHLTADGGLPPLP